MSWLQTGRDGETEFHTDQSTDETKRVIGKGLIGSRQRDEGRVPQPDEKGMEGFRNSMFRPVPAAGDAVLHATASGLRDDARRAKRLGDNGISVPGRAESTSCVL